MNLVSVKALSELNLHGVKIDWTKEDKSIKEIRFHDGNGGRISIRIGEYGQSLKVMIQQPHEEVERYLLSGDLAGLTKVSEYFEDKYSAENKLSDYAEKVRGDHGLTISKIMVKIDDTGLVVDPAAKITDDDIPF